MMYILHEEYSKQTYYGPFEDYEIDDRLVDPYSLDLKLTGRLLKTHLSPEEIEIFDPLPASVWYDQLDEIFDADDYTFEYNLVLDLVRDAVQKDRPSQ
jgi:hypothetical protein